MKASTHSFIIMILVFLFVGRFAFADSNFVGCDISGAYLRSAKLSFANFSGTIMRDTILQEADLKGAILYEAILSGSDLSKANLNEADLRYADLSNCNFQHADLSGADLSGSYLTGANFENAIMKEIKAKNVFWRHVICPDGSESDNHGFTCEGHMSF